MTEHFERFYETDSGSEKARGSPLGLGWVSSAEDGANLSASARLSRT